MECLQSERDVVGSRTVFQPPHACLTPALILTEGLTVRRRSLPHIQRVGL